MQLIIFYLYLMLHTCVQRFDDMMGERENILGLHGKSTQPMPYDLISLQVQQPYKMRDHIGTLAN
jgi:hypothetical protein